MVTPEFLVFSITLHCTILIYKPFLKLFLEISGTVASDSNSLYKHRKDWKKRPFLLCRHFTWCETRRAFWSASTFTVPNPVPSGNGGDPGHIHTAQGTLGHTLKAAHNGYGVGSGRPACFHYHSLHTCCRGPDLCLYLCLAKYSTFYWALFFLFGMSSGIKRWIFLLSFGFLLSSLSAFLNRSSRTCFCEHLQAFSARQLMTRSLPGNGSLFIVSETPWITGPG